MTDFPTNIKIFDAATFREGVEDPAIEPGEMEGGYSITRPKFTRAPRRSFSWSYVEMRDADKAALQAFWTLVRGRSAAFNWTHPVSGEVINCRFGEMKLEFSRTGYGPLNIWKSDTIVIQEI